MAKNIQKVVFCLFLSGLFEPLLPVPFGQWKEYTIQRHDNLQKIASANGVSLSEICLWNKIANPNRIFVGQKIKILNHDEKNANLAASPGSSFGKISLQKPLKNWRVLRAYNGSGDQRNYGILLAARPSSPVYAASEGQVSKIGYMRGYGRYIMVDHDNGWLTMYSLIDNIKVQPGQKVDPKTILGQTRNDKMFFVTSYKGRPVDPGLFL